MHDKLTAEEWYAVSYSFLVANVKYHVCILHIKPDATKVYPSTSYSSYSSHSSCFLFLTFSISPSSYGYTFFKSCFFTKSGSFPPSRGWQIRWPWEVPGSWATRRPVTPKPPGTLTGPWKRAARNWFLVSLCVMYVS